MGVSIINLVLLVGVCLLLTNIALNCLFHTENKKASLVRVCDTPVKENLVSFVLIKDGLRVGGVVDKSHVALIGE